MQQKGGLFSHQLSSRTVVVINKWLRPSMLYVLESVPLGDTSEEMGFVSSETEKRTTA